ncbi:MAG: DMT family protein [Marinilabiliaceae bacterium]|nr:DMT family protein [Bacteroidales bacterium]MDD5814897.1 DMT family protein [Bacteroidales bacterium]
MKGLWTILLLIVSNSFMTMAWYGHLRLSQTKWGSGLSLLAIILLSWGIALFEYCCQVPANRIGFEGNGGPFSLLQLKVIQEVISLSVFTVFALAFFKNEAIRWNHIVAFVLLVGAVYFMFKK